jgi:AhpD family alkylhydroperoxidase
MLALETYVRESSKLKTSLLDLVRRRASQINGCAFCLDMHSKDARAEGETEQRLGIACRPGETSFYRLRIGCA